MIDWASARLDYVTHHELTFADIASKYRATLGTIWNRAAQECWTEQSKTASKELLEKVREKAVFNASEELARCNASHLELAARMNIKPAIIPANDVEGLVKAIRAQKNGAVVVVGHSNKLPEIIAVLGGPKVNIPDSDYDNLFVMTVESSQSSLLRLHY